jgi:prepilin-type processing-associated H-X9-DG protein
MKPHFQKRSNRALTLPEVLFVVFVIGLLIAILLPVLNRSHIGGGPTCANNLKQVNLSLRIWEGDNNNKYPMAVSVTNGGAMELIAANNIAALFLVMTNELSTPKFLKCPADKGRIAATSFVTNFSNANISYFINPDANETYPQEIMSGDDNLAVDGAPVKSGLVVLPSNAQVSWTAARHRFIGNIGYADGSVAGVSSSGLQSSLILATNGTPTTIIRLAIP